MRVAGDAAAHVLKAGLARHDGVPALGAARQCQLPEDVILHEGQDLAEGLVLVVVRIDVDDEDVVEVALLRLLRGMGEQAGRVQLVDWIRVGRGQRSGP